MVNQQCLHSKWKVQVCKYENQEGEENGIDISICTSRNNTSRMNSWPQATESQAPDTSQLLKNKLFLFALLWKFRTTLGLTQVQNIYCIHNFINSAFDQKKELQLCTKDKKDNSYSEFSWSSFHLSPLSSSRYGL